MPIYELSVANAVTASRRSCGARIAGLPVLSVPQSRTPYFPVCRRCPGHPEQVSQRDPENEPKVTNDKAWADFKYDKKHRNE